MLSEWEGALASCVVCFGVRRHVLRVGKWCNRMSHKKGDKEQQQQDQPLSPEAAMWNKMNPDIPSSTYDWLQTWITITSHHRIALFIIIYPLTARIVGAPQMISQPVSSSFPCSPLPSGTWQASGLSIHWCCFPTTSSVCLVFSPLLLCLARWFWPNLMNGRHVHNSHRSFKPFTC